MKIKIFTGAGVDVEQEANQWLQENKGVTVEKLSSAKDHGALSVVLLYSGEERDQATAAAVAVFQASLEHTGGLPELEIEPRN